MCAFRPQGFEAEVQPAVNTMSRNSIEYDFNQTLLAYQAFNSFVLVPKGRVWRGGGSLGLFDLATTRDAGRYVYADTLYIYISPIFTSHW